MEINQIPKNVKENKVYRYRLLTAAEESKEKERLRAEIIRMCELDFKFFFNSLAWTYDPRKADGFYDLPFILYDYQEDWIGEQIKNIESGMSGFTEKSRDMGFSWMIVTLQVWAFLFKRWSSLYGSYKQEYVDDRGNMDSHFERVRYLFDKLPKWIKPQDLICKYMSCSSSQLGCEIAGDVGENFGTGGRRKFVILDEYALWLNDRKAFRKTADITNCRIFGGTPEGRWNIYGKVMTEHKDYRDLNFKKYRLHWTQHPLKDTAWYEAQKETRTKLDIAKELDISYDDSVTGAVYPDFNTIVKFGKFEFDPKKYLYTSWDYGRDMTAIIWWQKDFLTDQLYIVDAFQKEDMDIDFFAAFVTGEPTSGYVYNQEELALIEKHRAWKHRYARHIGDPYNGSNRSSLTTNTIAKQLRQYGIYLFLNNNRDSTASGSEVLERIRKTTLALRRFNVNEELADYIQAMIQAKYPSEKENNEATREKTVPIHNATSHLRTATEYFIDCEPQSDYRASVPNSRRSTTIISTPDEEFDPHSYL